MEQKTTSHPLVRCTDFLSHVIALVLPKESMYIHDEGSAFTLGRRQNGQSTPGPTSLYAGPFSCSLYLPGGSKKRGGSPTTPASYDMTFPGLVSGTPKEEYAYDHHRPADRM